MSDAAKKSPSIATPAPTEPELELKVRRVRVSTSTKAGVATGPIIFNIPGGSTW